MLGTPKKFLIDNGIEFSNAHYVDMCENLKIEICSSAGESLWQNEICGKIMQLFVLKRFLSINQRYA